MTRSGEGINIAELQNRVLHNASLGMFVKDADDDFRYIDVNDYFLRSVGLRREEVIGRRDHEIWAADMADRYRENDETALAHNTSDFFYETYDSPCGRSHYVQTVRTSVRADNGHRCIVGYWVDVSVSVAREGRMEKERDAALQAERSEAFIARLLKGVVAQPLGTDPMDYLLEQIGRELQIDRCYIYTCKSDGNGWKTDRVYEWCNDGVRSERENLIQKGPPGLPDFCATIDAGGDYMFSDVEEIHPVTRAWFNSRGVKSFFSTPIRDEKGVSVGYLGFDYVRSQKLVFSSEGRAYAHEAGSVVNVCYMRQRALDDVSRAERARNDFFASVSHDIRTPLNSIIGFTELLRTETDPGRCAEYVEDVSFSCIALLDLINDVLDLSMMDSGKLTLHRSLCDIRSLLVRVLRTQEITATEKGVALVYHFEQDLPRLFIDERRMRQVLFNIVGNAVKYTDRGKVEVDVSFVRETADRGTVRLAVSDTGIGIAAEDIPRLMHPYVRIQAENARGGTGLGLSICKRIVELAGGRINIESKLGEGSVFTVTEPGVMYREVDGSGRCDGAEICGRATYDLSGIRVLVVDDIELNRKVIVAMCRKLGVCDVETAESGRSALARLEGGLSVDVVFTDMKMPDMSGGELIVAMRRNPCLAHLPAYLVTADVAALKYSSEVGAAGVLLKPIRSASLQEILVAVCRNMSANSPS